MHALSPQRRPSSAVVATPSLWGNTLWAAVKAVLATKLKMHVCEMQQGKLTFQRGKERHDHVWRWQVHERAKLLSAVLKSRTAGTVSLLSAALQFGAVRTVSIVIIAMHCGVLQVQRRAAGTAACGRLDGRIDQFASADCCVD